MSFIEMLVYSSLFSLLFSGVVGTWLVVARSNATFERLAEAQETSLFIAGKIQTQIENQTDYDNAKVIVNADLWHTISPPIMTLDSSSSISHIDVSFSPLTASSSWHLDNYELSQ